MTRDTYVLKSPEDSKKKFAAIVWSIAGIAWIILFVSIFSGSSGPSSTSSSTTTYHDREVRIGETGVLRSKSEGSVWIFKSLDDAVEARDLYKAGADQSLIYSHLACVVLDGTRVLNITGQLTGAWSSGSNNTSDVMVTNGPRAGCKGVVSDTFLKKY